MATSVDGGSPRTGAYEYLYLARSGNGQNGPTDPSDDIVTRQFNKIGRTGSIDQYVQMRPVGANGPCPQPSPRNLCVQQYENTKLRSYNPNRKLRRSRDNYEHFSIEYV